MIQYKVFTGTIAEIEQAFNVWAASLVQGVNVNAGPLTMIVINDSGEMVERWYKEVMYVLPARPNNGITIPQMLDPREVSRGRQPS